MKKKTTYFSARPVIFRAHPILFGLCLITPGVGWLFLIYWLLDNAGTRIEVTPTDVAETKWFGFGTKRVDVPLDNIQTTRVAYGLRGKNWNAGTVVMTLKDDKKIALSAVESPADLAILIEKLRA